MDPNGSVPPPPPPPPSGETFVASLPQSPKKKAHPFLVAFLVLFILFDIGIGALVFLNKNKKQNITTPYNTQETGANTATETQSTSDSTVKQEGITSLAAPSFENKLIFRSYYKGTRTLVALDPDGKNPIDLPLDVNQGNIDRFYMQGSLTSRYILLYDARVSSGLEQDRPIQYYLYSTYDKKVTLLDTSTITNTMDRQVKLPLFLGWSNDDRKILFYGARLLDDRTMHVRHFVVSYDIASKTAKEVLRMDLNKYYKIDSNFYSETDKVFVYTLYDMSAANQGVGITPSKHYYRDLKTNEQREVQPAKLSNYHHALYTYSHCIYYADQSIENSDAQTFDILSIKDPTKPIRKIHINAEANDAVIKTIVWSNDCRYLAVYVQYYDNKTKTYARNSSLYFYTLEGEEVMHDTIEDLTEFTNREWVDLPKGQLFAANNKYFILTFRPPGGQTTWKTYDLEDKKIIAQFGLDGYAYGFEFQPLAWY